MRKENSHIIVISSVVIAIVIIGLFGVRLFRPKSYGEHGNYRFDAIGDIQSQTVITQSTITCSECHNDIYQLHEKDAHYNVPCVDCHGPGNLHVSFHKGDENSKNITKEQAVMEKEYKLEGCLYCHRKLKAKPSDYPQISQEEHYKFLHVIDPNTKCIQCHSPHEPAYLLTEVKQSRIHPIVYRCTECHEQTPANSFKDVPSHPTIFECKDCHSELVKDFNQRPHHNYVECRTCHLFHIENETAGRIYKNGNAKFCLMCHEKKPFKDEKYPPKIEWPAHIGEKGIIEKSDEKICLNCHSDKIHTMNITIRTNPHSGTWISEHKEFAKKNLNLCQNCHTPNQCSSCHSKTKPLSHKDNWLKLHPISFKNNKQNCNMCHKNNFCINCHGLEMPHPKGFTENHKDVVAQKGDEICKKCHDDKFCGKCH